MRRWQTRQPATEAKADQVPARSYSRGSLITDLAYSPSSPRATTKVVGPHPHLLPSFSLLCRHGEDNARRCGTGSRHGGRCPGVHCRQSPPSARCGARWVAALDVKMGAANFGRARARVGGPRRRSIGQMVSLMAHRWEPALPAFSASTSLQLPRSRG